MPVLDRPVILAMALAYLALVMGIGVWAARRTKSPRDFFIAGQSIGLLVTTLATMSAIFSGFLFIGGPGLTYRMGVASFFISVPAGFTAALLAWTVGVRLRLLAEVRDVLTVPDAVSCRYRSRWASGLAAAAIVVGAVAYLGAQVKALGILLEAVFGTARLFGDASLPLAMATGALVILVYATAGGMVAGVYTDVVQGVLMMGSGVAVFVYALATGGGLGGITRRIAESEAFGPAFLDPLGNVPVMTALGFFFVFGIGALGQPQTLHKFYMIDDPMKLRFLPLTLGVSQALVLLVWAGIGLTVPALVASGRLAPLQNPDEATPAFLLGFVPPALAGLVVAGVLAAIMSTADSFVNVASAALVHDLPKALGKRVERELAWGRGAVVGVMVLATLLAFFYGDLIALLGTFAFGTFAAALVPALAVGLNWTRVTPAAAVASIATGLALNVGLELWAKQVLAPVLPTAVALAASFTVLFLVTWWTGGGRDDRLDEDVRAVMEV